ncbi:hypothetical protein M0R89_13690 [Halorussus limi]|uniref:Uncharacterized protein n=1 Tax=Halorussus limi TaxID=2938695 RepID=A0A8U0HRS1_9EURY|nr:hypothetical protein [Halorussus limi]UPV73587.1 hypothetical protein M0R89_13690 [Halorussus limi]
MPTDVRTHPDAPDLEKLQNLVLEPIPQEEIRRRRENGEVLAEDVVNDREDLDVRAPMSDGPGEPVEGDVGTALYRLVQLFGTPTFPEYMAGEDISDRRETTYKYLFRVELDDDVEDLPDEWLITVGDWKVEVGVGVCEWRDEKSEFTADPQVALTSMALAQNVTTEPVQCEFKDIWY